jgi:hypothetical protein
MYFLTIENQDFGALSTVSLLHIFSIEARDCALGQQLFTRRLQKKTAVGQ